MQRLVRLIPVLLVLALAVPLGACGKKGSLDPPPDEKPVEYPKQYPR